MLTPVEEPISGIIYPAIIINKACTNSTAGSLPCETNRRIASPSSSSVIEPEGLQETATGIHNGTHITTLLIQDIANPQIYIRCICGILCSLVHSKELVECGGDV
jgi:hypothetical protein